MDRLACVPQRMFDWAAQPDAATFAGSVFTRSRQTPENLVTSLFELYRDSLYRYLLLITRNPSISEELVQEAFLRLHRELQNGARVENHRAWLFRVGGNLAFDYGKSQTSEPLDLDMDPAAAAANPEEECIARERALRLAMVIHNLPPMQKHCFLLRSEGFRYREIAAILAIGETTVVDHLRRAIDRLRKELHAQGV